MIHALDRVTNWEERAKEVRYSVAGLAKCAGVSQRVLYEYIKASRGQSPSVWMDELKMKDIAARLANGEQIKSFYADVGFKQPTNVSRAFRRVRGSNPKLKFQVKGNGKFKH